MLFVLKGRPRPRDVFLGSVIDGAFGRPVEQHRVLTSAAAARHHNPFTMAPVPTLQEIFAAAFASIRKAELGAAEELRERLGHEQPDRDKPALACAPNAMATFWLPEASRRREPFLRSLLLLSPPPAGANSGNSFFFLFLSQKMCELP